MTHLALILALASPATRAADEAATLAGVVRSDKGKPLAGARVFVSTAGPRQGAGQL